MVFASCEADQVSLGVVRRDRNGTVVDEGTYNLFPAALMEGLDANGDGVVTLAELSDYLVKRVAPMKAELARRLPGKGFGRTP